jgi:hypothetical protein
MIWIAYLVVIHVLALIGLVVLVGVWGHGPDEIHGPPRH